MRRHGPPDLPAPRSTLARNYLRAAKEAHMAIPKDDRSFYVYDADHRFAKMYPLLARELVEDYSITQGLCLDMGAGSAALCIELSRITQLDFIALDNESEALDFARENCRQHDMPENRIRFFNASAEQVPLDDASVSLLVSRGSIPFWDDHVAVFREIHRLLAPGAVALVGCGFSRFQSLDEVKRMRPSWTSEILKERTRWKKDDFLPRTLQAAGVTEYSIRDDAYGTWVEIRTRQAAPCQQG